MDITMDCDKCRENIRKETLNEVLRKLIYTPDGRRNPGKDIDNFAITIDISEVKKMIRELKERG